MQIYVHVQCTCNVHPRSAFCAVSWSVFHSVPVDRVACPQLKVSQTRRFTACEESLSPCTCTRVRHFSTCFNFSTWAPLFWCVISRWSTWYSLFSQKMFALTGPNVIEILEITMEGQQIKLCKSIQLGVKKLWNGERILKLVPQFKSDNIWPPPLEKWQKNTILPFWQFVLPTRGQMLSDLNYETRFRILSSLDNSLATICEDFHIWFFASHSSFQNFNDVGAD